MNINYKAYRESKNEKERIGDLFQLIPERGSKALDIGARDGFLSLKLAERFDKVIALDLEKPKICHPSVECISGNALDIKYPDSYFDTVVCAEVLEHISTEILSDVCNEISRVAKKFIVIGVPYRQDTRFGKTTCSHCGKTNPPWGHVNSFDEISIKRYFSTLKVDKTTFIGATTEKTNFLSAALMEFAGNPYGSYYQEEPCVFCGNSLGAPSPRNFIQKTATKIAVITERVQRSLSSTRPIWIHVLFEK